MTTALPVLVVLAAPGEDAPPQVASLRDHFEVRVTDADGLPSALPGADVLFIWDFFNPALASAWEAQDRLTWMHVAAAGVDAIMFDGLRNSDVVLTNAHGVFDQPIAEFVLASVLADAKLVHQSADLQREHQWKHREPRAVAGARAVVVGTGGIGRAIARLLTAVGMKVTGAGRTPRTGDPDFGDVIASEELVNHVSEADYLINAAPLTQQTRNLLNSAVFQALPSHAHVVNIGRGQSLVEADLVDALRGGEVSGASLDVFEVEPLPADSPLWDVPGLRISAHMSGDVAGWRDRLAEQFVDLADRWLHGQEMPHVVDKTSGYVSSRSDR